MDYSLWFPPDEFITSNELEHFERAFKINLIWSLVYHRFHTLLSDVKDDIFVVSSVLFGQICDDLSLYATYYLSLFFFHLVWRMEIFLEKKWCLKLVLRVLVQLQHTLYRSLILEKRECVRSYLKWGFPLSLTCSYIPRKALTPFFVIMRNTIDSFLHLQLLFRHNCQSFEYWWRLMHNGLLILGL